MNACFISAVAEICWLSLPLLCGYHVNPGVARVFFLNNTVHYPFTYTYSRIVRPQTNLTWNSLNLHNNPDHSSLIWKDKYAFPKHAYIFKNIYSLLRTQNIILLMCENDYNLWSHVQSHVCSRNLKHSDVSWRANENIHISGSPDTYHVECIAWSLSY